MRSVKAEQSTNPTPDTLGDWRSLCAGQSYLERLGVLYMDELRLTIVMELSMREMGALQFFETIGGSSKDSVRRHFRTLVKSGWIRRVRSVPARAGRGRPEALYRATERAVIDTETWRTIPVSIRDAFTVMLLEEMGSRLGEALEGGTAEAGANGVAVFKALEVDALAWCRAHEAVERCFQALEQEQIDAKRRLVNSPEQPLLMIVNLGAFEAPGPRVSPRLALPKVAKLPPPGRWPHRIGKVFSDRIDLSIIDELNRATMTPAQLQEAIGGTSVQGFLRRCKRLTELGWAVNMDTQTGGELHGANVYHFRAASPAVSEQDIIDMIPLPRRRGQTWDAFKRFLATSIRAVDAGTFNHRFDRHLTMTPLLVDEIGWAQVTKTLQGFHETLTELENELEKRRRGKRFDGFHAAFLLSNFQTPLREMQG